MKHIIIKRLEEIEKSINTLGIDRVSSLFSAKFKGEKQGILFFAEELEKIIQKFNNEATTMDQDVVNSDIIDELEHLLKQIKETRSTKTIKKEVYHLT